MRANEAASDTSTTAQVRHPEARVKIGFGPFTVDLDTRQLTRGGCELHLSPKAFDLLVALAAERPKVISKAALQRHLWPHTFVDEANLSNLVAEVRHVLDDPARCPAFIRTAHGIGYAFCGDAVTDVERRRDQPREPVGWLDFEGRHIPLVVGEYVIGRDPDVEITLDDTTVSRRHARLVVTADCTVLEDIASKNGTFRGDERVTQPVVLVDGDSVRIGSLLVTFHRRPALGSTDTQRLDAVR